MSSLSSLSFSFFFLKHTGGNNNNWISDVKFSPNGEFVAFSAHDGHVFIYDTKNLKSSMNGGKNKGTNFFWGG